MKRSTALLLFVALCICVFLLLCACSGENSKTHDALEGDIETNEDDMLTVVVASDLGNMDPHNNNAFAHSQVTRQVFETLFIRDSNGVLQPWLCEDYEYEDDKTIILHIRKNITFHNGEQLKANDVLFSLSRAVNENTAGALQAIYVDFELSSIIDDYTLKLVTKSPYPMQIAMLESPLIAIINEKSFNENNGDFSKIAIGTGPYKFVSYSTGDKVILKANESYWVAGFPHIKNLVFRIISDSSSRAIEAETGGADIVYDIGATDLKRLESNPNVNVVRRAGYNTKYLCFNTAQKPLDDIRVRQAIWYGIDLKSAVDMAFGDFGKLASGVISPGVEGRNENLKSYFSERDVNMAKSLLREAGYTNGIELSVCTANSDQPFIDFCEVIQAQLSEIGIKLSLDLKETNAWVSTMVSGEAQLGIYGQTASTGEAGRVLMRFLPTAAEARIFNWNNKDYIDLCEGALITMDDNERNNKYEKCQIIIMESFIALPVWHKELNAAVQKNVKGFELMPTYEQHYLQHVKF